MQQRQLRLGDILDDYCPRERRVTNHAVVAMVGPDVKQTRCTTCEAEHEYKHGKMPRQRRKSEAPAILQAQASNGGPKRVVHEPTAEGDQDLTAAAAPSSDGRSMSEESASSPIEQLASEEADSKGGTETTEGIEVDAEQDPDVEEGPVHRPLIRATLPRVEGQPPPTRPAPDFTIRQPGGRPGRFRPRHQRGGQPFPGNRSNGNAPGGPLRGGAPRHQGGRPPQGAMPRLAGRHGPGRKRSK